MADTSDPHAEAHSAPASALKVSPALEAELRRAAEELARGDFIELGTEQLERAAATGESPWPDGRD